MPLGRTDSLVAVVVSVAVGVLLFARRQRTSGAAPLAALCFAVAVWHLGDWVFSIGRSHPWRVVSAIGSVAPAPLLVHFLVAALGGRAMRAVRAFYVVTGLFGVASSWAFFDPTAYAFVRSTRWVLLYVVLLLPPMVLAIAWAVRASRVEGDPARRTRARWWIGGAAIGVFGGLFDLANLAHQTFPGFGAIGTTLGLLCVAWTLDLGAASEGAVATRSSLLFVAVAAIAAFVTSAVSRLTTGRVEAVVAVGAAATIAALAAFRIASARLQRDAMRMQSLALLGTFAAEVAHEAKNPLAAIRGAVQLLARKAEKGADPETFREYLRLIDSEVERLDGVVSDYHALSRPGSVRTERAQLSQVVRDVVGLHGPVLPANVRVETQLDDALPPVQADAARLRQAILNLVRNAISAMPEGGTLTLRTSLDSAGPPAVLVDVEDTGVGIEPDELSKIFQPLYTRRAGGSGLGLAVTRRIAEEHGGAVRVRSRLGAGSTFTLALPIEAVRDTLESR